MYHVKIKKISNNENAMRTNEIEGISKDLPKIGQVFMLIGEGLEFGHRLFNTSEIKEVIELNQSKYKIITLNSVYEIDIINKVEEN